jgi:hypothetical protein
LSRRNAAIQKVIGFLTEHKDAPREIRGELARELTDQLLEKDGCTPVDLQTWTMLHPDLIRKSSARRYGILEVLADFILDVDMIAERSAEYPITNAEADLYRDKKRKRHERYLILDEHVSESDPDAPPPPGTIYEHAFNTGNPVEAALFNVQPSGQMTVEALRDLIRKIKTNPEPYVRKYADGSAWNADRPEKRRTKRAVRAAIRALDERRVRTCRVCRNGFYSRNGRFVCDVVRSREDPSKSLCDREYEKNYKKYSESADLA